MLAVGNNVKSIVERMYEHFDILSIGAIIVWIKGDQSWNLSM